jgi:hypothetical protein
MIARSDGAGHDFLIGEAALAGATDAKSVSFLKIDGDRNGQFVLFAHDSHIAHMESRSGAGESCVQCHHMNLPFDTNTACHECHRDMYADTDIFDHASHVEALGGNDGCVQCHADDSVVKTRATAKPCLDCHADMLVKDSIVKPRPEGLVGYAPGYQRAMHDEFAQEGFCIDCHAKTATRRGRTPKGADHALTRCDACHRDSQLPIVNYQLSIKN